MNRFLQDSDYEQAIQIDNLNQVIENNYKLLLNIEKSAILEMEGYLTIRYDTDRCFNPIQSFSTASQYKANDIVNYTEPDFITYSFYNPNDRVNFNGVIYQQVSATGSTGSPGDGNWIANWQVITDNGQLFYVKYPFKEWNENVSYKTGDSVFMEDFVYMAGMNNINVIPGNEQENVNGNVTIGNAPTGTMFNEYKPYYWNLVGTQSYTIENYYPDNTNYWIQGDNRNSQIVMYLLDIIIYHLHCRINPRNIPDLKAIRYDGASPEQKGGAIGWLKRCADGGVLLKIREKVPFVGSSIIWGSEYYRNNNQY